MRSKLVSHTGKTEQQLAASYRRNYTRHSSLLAELKPVTATKGTEEWKKQTLERIKNEADLRGKMRIAKRELIKLGAWKT